MAPRGIHAISEPFAACPRAGPSNQIAPLRHSYPARALSTRCQKPAAAHRPRQVQGGVRNQSQSSKRQTAKRISSGQTRTLDTLALHGCTKKGQSLLRAPQHHPLLPRATFR